MDVFPTCWCYLAEEKLGLADLLKSQWLLLQSDNIIALEKLS